MIGPAEKAGRWVRRVGLIVAAVLAALFLRRYEFHRLPPEIAGLGSEIPPGTVMVLVTVEDSTEIGVGSVVEAEFEGKVFYSRVAAVAGAEVRLLLGGDGQPSVYVGETPTRARVPGNSPLRSGRIPEGHVLLIDPDPDAGGADSRHVGLVPRTRLRRKVLGSLPL